MFVDLCKVGVDGAGVLASEGGAEATGAGRIEEAPAPAPCAAIFLARLFAFFFSITSFISPLAQRAVFAYVR